MGKTLGGFPQMAVFLRSAAPEEAPAPWMLEASDERSSWFVEVLLGKSPGCFLPMCVECQWREAPESYGTKVTKVWKRMVWVPQSRQMVGKSSFFRPARRAIQATKDSLHVGFSLPCGRSGSGGWRYSKWNDHHLCWAFRCRDHGEPNYGIHGFLPLLITQANHFRCPRLVDPTQSNGTISQRGFPQGCGVDLQIWYPSGTTMAIA